MSYQVCVAASFPNRSFCTAASTHSSEDYVARVKEFAARAKIQNLDQALLHQALQHTSFLKGKNPENSNKRLEVVGDKVLRFVVCTELMKQHPRAPHYKLQHDESSYVNNITLALTAENIGLAEVVRWEDGESARVRGRQKVLAQALEALIGALYKEHGIEAASSFVCEHILALDPSTTRETLKRVPVKALTHELRSRNLPYPHFRVRDAPQTETYGHQNEYTMEVLCGTEVIGSGTASSKRQAMKAAASAALKEARWEHLNVEEGPKEGAYDVGVKGI